MVATITGSSPDIDSINQGRAIAVKKLPVWKIPTLAQCNKKFRLPNKVSFSEFVRMFLLSGVATLSPFFYKIFGVMKGDDLPTRFRPL